MLSNIAQTLVEELNAHGIKASTNVAPGTAEAQLIVEIASIETTTSTAPALWAPVVRQGLRMTYSASIISESGTTLKRFEDQREDETIEKLSKRVGQGIGRRASKYLK